MGRLYSLPPPPPLEMVKGVGRQQNNHMDKAYTRLSRTTASYVAESVSFCLHRAVAFSTFMICVYLLLCWLCVCKFGVKCDS